MRQHGAGVKLWGWEGGLEGWTGCTKECRGSGLKAHVAICLKEEGSISNFRSKAGQLKHGGLSYTVPQHV